MLFNLEGQKAVIWNAGTGAVVEEDARLGARPLVAYLYGSLNYEHQDWLGTERLLTKEDGSVQGSYDSLPFGDGFSSSGYDVDPYHFSGLDHDYESGLDHAQYREYQNAGGRWLSPDPYQGSYDFSNPQSLNRYSYALNDPLSLSDPLGLFTNGAATAAGCTFGPFGCAVGIGIDLGLGAVFGDILNGIFGGGPSFHGSLKPRPNAQPWDEYNIHYGPNIAGALGLPDATCDFGPCGGGMGFGSGAGSVATSSRFASIVNQFDFLPGFFKDNNLPGVSKPNDPILAYSQCASQVRVDANKANKITGLAQALTFGNLLGACVFTGPETPVCVAGVGTVGFVFSITKFAIKQTSIFQGENACLQQY